MLLLATDSRAVVQGGELIQMSGSSPKSVKGDTEVHSECPVLLLENINSSRVWYKGIFHLHQDDPSKGKMWMGK